MPVSPYEPKVTAPGADRVPEHAGSRETRGASPAPHDADEDGQRHEEPIEEPGYGHGV
jgi:hypothetical protein